MARLDDPHGAWKAHDTTRKVGLVVAALLVAYALFGYFTDSILIFTGGRARGTGPEFAKGGQALLAALGYLSLAVAALIVAVGGFVKRPKRIIHEGKEVDVPQLGISNSVVFAVVFVIIGIVLAGFRTAG